MSHRVLITGASGYLGGTLLARLGDAQLPPYEKLYALVRSSAQADAVKQYGAEPMTFDAWNETAVSEAIVENEINIVFFLVDAMRPTSQVLFIDALAKVKQKTGKEVHFLHTTGAKLFSSHAGAPTDGPLLDTDQNLYSTQKGQVSSLALVQGAVATNNTVIETAEAKGVRSYIFAPCIVYGKGEGFGNPISIQTVAIVKAGKAIGGVRSVDKGRPAWPVCHVIDNTNLYIKLLRQILLGENPSYGKAGYYLAASGNVAWEDIYAAIAAALVNRGVIKESGVQMATDAELEQMGAALGCPKEMVPLQVGGSCTFTARRGLEMGWKPQYPPTYILEAAQDEVDVILAQLST